MSVASLFLRRLVRTSQIQVAAESVRGGWSIRSASRDRDDMKQIGRSRVLRSVLAGEKPMSEQLYGAMPNQTGQVGNAPGRIYDAQGRTIRSGNQQAQSTAVQMEDYIRTQPFSAVLIALGIGY